MLRNAMVVLAVVLVPGSFGLSTAAFARGGGFGVTPGDGYNGHGNRASGLRGRIPHVRGPRCVWGQWGAYYGPMIPNSF